MQHRWQLDNAVIRHCQSFPLMAELSLGTNYTHKSFLVNAQHLHGIVEEAVRYDNLIVARNLDHIIINYSS